MDIHFYNNRYSEKINSELVRFKFFHKADNYSLFRDLARWRILSENQIVLDAGSGWSFHASFIETHFKSIVFRADLSQVALKEVSKTNNRVDSKGKFVVADLQRLPIKNEVFDLILCSQVIEHIPNDSIALNEFYRTLKQDGTLVVTVPNCYRRMPSLFHKLQMKFDESGHIHEYCIEEICDLLEKSGFKILKGRHHCFGLFWFIAKIERTSFALKLSKIFKNRMIAKSLFLILSWFLILENSIVSKVSKGGMSIEVIAEKS